MSSTEQKLFTWTGWDQHDTACFEFYKCELIVPIKHFEAKTKFDNIIINYDKSTIVF
jgi:hypothetical protein